MPTAERDALASEVERLRAESEWRTGDPPRAVEYLVTRLVSGEPVRDLAIWSCGAWVDCDGYLMPGVVAWRPLPPPYRPPEEQR